MLKNARRKIGLDKANPVKLHPPSVIAIDSTTTVSGLIAKDTVKAGKIAIQTSISEKSYEYERSRDHQR
jgi:hypothetical protein